MVIIKTRQPRIHSFTKSLARAKVFEAELDKHYGQAYRIEAATMEQERLGIDRIFTHRRGSARYSVEYKTDHVTHETGNVFVETKSVDNRDLAGWGFTSVSQVLIYYVTGEPSDGNGYALRADMTDVKRRLASGQYDGYREASAENQRRDGTTYKTWGRLVPVEVFRETCVGVDDIGYPLDAGENFDGYVGLCIHDLFYEKCYSCGRVK